MRLYILIGGIEPLAFQQIEDSADLIIPCIGEIPEGAIPQVREIGRLMLRIKTGADMIFQSSGYAKHKALMHVRLYMFVISRAFPYSGDTSRYFD